MDDKIAALRAKLALQTNETQETMSRYSCARLCREWARREGWEGEAEGGEGWELLLQNCEVDYGVVLEILRAC
jgi:hypothetical protein